ncbi:MAG: tetratricopeptide repeat protein [Kiritimatiellia bacterium]
MIKSLQIAGWLIVVLILTQVVATAQERAAWAVKDAPVRYVVRLSRAPSHPEAGYFVKIPDGGALPGPRPECIVLDEGGKPLQSGILWHSKETECGLVFQAPESGGSATIYFKGTRNMNLWNPESGIKPSAILCEAHGTRAKTDATKLGKLGAVDSSTRFVNKAWSAGHWKGQRIPLAVWEWRMGGSAFYMLAHIDVKAPGATWIAPYSRSGEMEIVVDGKTLKQRKKNNKLGGVGDTVDLAKGLHRVELYFYNPKGSATGPMMFTWRTPKTTVEELGGPRDKELPYPGTPMCESCVIGYEDVVKSGECVIIDASAQAGPIAAFSFAPNSIFWLNDEPSLISCFFKSLSQSNPAATRYSWRFEKASGAVADGAEISWLLNDRSFTKVSLTAEADGKSSVASYVIYPYTDNESSLDDADTRQDFKLACYNMLRAYPAAVDPVAGWHAGMWNNFFRVLELKRGNALLEYVMTERWDYFKKKVDPEQKALMQDLFLLALSLRDPQAAIKWADKFSADEFSSARTAVLKLTKAEIMLYYLNDPEGARKVITPLLRDAGEGGEWAKIRMGDLEFLAHNLNQATQRYGDVQSRSKALGEESFSTRLTPLSSGGATRKAEKSRKTEEVAVVGKKERREEKELEELSKFIPMKAPSSVPAWKLAAIRDVAASENISMLISQGFLLEAFRDLRMWERALPMSKISGDFLLREAKFYMELQDYQRARKILSAYCEQVDISNFLPEAMSMIRSCMIEMKETDAAIEKYEKEIMKRTVFGTPQE